MAAWKDARRPFFVSISFSILMEMSERRKCRHLYYALFECASYWVRLVDSIPFLHTHAHTQGAFSWIWLLPFKFYFFQYSRWKGSRRCGSWVRNELPNDECNRKTNELIFPFGMECHQFSWIFVTERRSERRWSNRDTKFKLMPFDDLASVCRCCCRFTRKIENWN